MSDALALLTMEQAAARLTMHVRTLREHVKRGRISYVEIGNGSTRHRRMFHADDLAAFGRPKAPEPAPEPGTVDFQAIGVDIKKRQIDRAWGGSPPKGFIYFISRPPQFVKIGFSQNPEARLRQLKMATPEKLKLDLAVPGTMREEKLLQLRFRGVRAQGEWFYKSKDIAALISRLRDDPDSLLGEARSV